MYTTIQIYFLLKISINLQTSLEIYAMVAYKASSSDKYWKYKLEERVVYFTSIGNSLWERGIAELANWVGKTGGPSPFFEDVFIQSFQLIITRQMNSTTLLLYSNTQFSFQLCAIQRRAPKIANFLIFTTCTRLI